MNKKTLKGIYKTVSSYYETNKDVLLEREIKEIKNQKIALKKEMHKFGKQYFETGKVYGYSICYVDGEGVGIVIADNKKNAKKKIKRNYIKRGYSKNNLEDLKVWKFESCCFFTDSPDILEIN